MSNNNQYNDNQNQYETAPTICRRTTRISRTRSRTIRKITSRTTRRTRTSRNITFSSLAVCGYFHKDAVIRRRISGR